MAFKKKPRGLGWRPNLPREVDAKRKALFIEKLAEHGIVGQAAKAASLHSHNGCIATFYRERERDPEFARQWEEALLQARYAVEAELHRRAVEGVEEPVFYLGKEIGTITRYSDQLLLARIRKLDPEYRPAQRIEHGGTVNIKPIGLDQLNKTQREHLRAILVEQVKTVEATVVETPLLEDTSDGEASPLEAYPEDPSGDQGSEEPSP